MSAGNREATFERRADLRRGRVTKPFVYMTDGVHTSWVAWDRIYPAAPLAPRLLGIATIDEITVGGRLLLILEGERQMKSMPAARPVSIFGKIHFLGLFVLFLLAGVLFSQESVVGTVGVGTRPFGVGVNATTGRVYVANRETHTVSVIDGASLTVVGTVGAGSGPTAVGVDGTRNRIYVTNAFSNTVTVIDGGTNAVVATVGVGSAPQGVAVDSANNRIFVTNSGGNTVSVVDGGTNAVRGDAWERDVSAGGGL